MSINTETGRKYDFYKNLIVPRGCYFIVRLDGNCFSSYTEQMERPFDKRFYNMMLSSAKKLMNYVPDIFKIHFHSDEMSCYFKKESDWFNRRVEKITSITSGIVSAHFSVLSDRLGLGEAHFDSRVLVTPTLEDIELYEEDRRLNAFRGCVNSYAFYKLAELVGTKQATADLESLSSKERQEFLFINHGINIAKVDPWERVGTFLEWEEYIKKGLNPVTNEEVDAVRRRIIIK